MAIVESSITPSPEQLTTSQLPGIDSKFYTGGSIEVEKMEAASSYSATIKIDNLQSQTKYQVFFMARSVFGEYTDIVSQSFKTLKVTEGVNLLIPSLGNCSIPNLIETLSIILPLSKDRLIYRGAEIFPLETVDNSDPVFGNQLNGYTITIAPDANNNVPSPSDIANELLKESKLAQLLSYIPQFYQKAGVRVTPVKRSSPRVIVAPTINYVGYYTVKIGIELIEVGSLYAIAIEETNDSYGKPSSYQIANGLMGNNEKIDERYYKVAATNKNGDGEIVFDELQDFTNYNVYITAGNDIPYEPVDLLDNSEVMKIDVRTLKNPSKFY